MTKRNNPEKVLAAILLSTLYALAFLALVMAVTAVIVVGVAAFEGYQRAWAASEDAAPMSAPEVDVESLPTITVPRARHDALRMKNVAPPVYFSYSL